MVHKNLLFTLVSSLLVLASVSTHGALTEVKNFGDNPGSLTAFASLTEEKKRPLVVLLHGCGQTAHFLAENSGLLAAADTKQFNLLLPQQEKTNNPQLCFNWFSTADQLKGQGETLSIMNMVNTISTEQQASDTYIVGLSAGGSMASSLMSQYPDNFKAGAIIAGIGYPCADNLIKALSCMKNGFTDSVQSMAQKLITDKNNPGKWPNLIVISGSSDAIVNPVNSDQLLQQWQLLLNIKKADSVDLGNENIKVKRAENSDSNQYVELITIENMGHGWPVNSKAQFGGKPAPFVLDTSFSASEYLVSRWDL